MRDLDAGRIQRADELRLRAAPRTTGVEVAKRIFEANTTGEDHDLDLLLDCGNLISFRLHFARSARDVAEKIINKKILIKSCIY